jgi:hypothetical protein
MTKKRQIEGKPVTKMSQDPRDSKCSINQVQKHKWSRSFKDIISKTRFIQILRCRYCARYVCVEFNRLVLPSGRVTVTERAFETQAGEMVEQATVGLHDKPKQDWQMERADNSERIAPPPVKTPA